MLKAIDLERSGRALREELRETTSEAKRKKIVKRLKLSRASSSPATARSG
jgi:DNA-directed RNA polymerase subunit beta'